MFVFDLHVHTAGISPCGKVPAEEMAAGYADAGFDGICITNHYNRDSIGRVTGPTWEDTARNYLAPFERAREVGASRGLTVLFGMEVQPLERFGDNEYLIYGLAPEFVIPHPRLYELSVPALAELVHGSGGVIYQSHPYRDKMKPDYVELLDGIEAFNGHPRAVSRNLTALDAARANGWGMIAGSDCHRLGEGGLGGVAFRTLPASERELADQLREKRYALLVSVEERAFS